jgi:two-component system, OmpR family, response regulator
MGPNRSRIIVSDDDPLIISSIERQLHRLKLELIPDLSSNVVELASQHLPGLILLDVVQKVSGTQLLRDLRGTPATRLIPVASMSAISDRKVRDECLKLGADLFLLKPLRDDDLAAIEKLTRPGMEFFTESTAEATGTPHGTVLLVDDSLTVIETTRDTLEEAGFRVVSSDNPFLLGSAIRRCMPDLVLIDVNMPGLPGDDAVKLVRSSANKNNVPVYLYSSAPAEELEGRVISSGANGFIRKTANGAELVRQILCCLDPHV